MSIRGHISLHFSPERKTLAQTSYKALGVGFLYGNHISNLKFVVNIQIFLWEDFVMNSLGLFG